MIVGLLCCLLIVIGAFGPWVKTAFGQSASGLDGSSDGWVMLVGGLGAAIVLTSFVRDPSRTSRVLRSLLILGAGIALFATGVYDWNNVKNAISQRQAEALVSVGWGLELATIASAALVVVALILLVGRPRDANRQSAERPLHGA